MNFPTLQQVRKQTPTIKRRLHSYPLTKEEISKIRSFNPNSNINKPIEHIDTEQSFQRVLNDFDSTFGPFYRFEKNNVIFRGKLEYYAKITDSETGEKQIVFTLSDPVALYRNRNFSPFYIKIPENLNLLTGIYADVKVDKKELNNMYPTSIEQSQIEYFDFTPNLPTLFMDYSKFTDIFKFDYNFDMSDTSQKLKRNFELKNIDRMLLNKIAGENINGDVRGGVNFNIIKTTHDRSSYELEVLDTFLDKVTINNNTKTVYNVNNVGCGTLTNFLDIVDNKNRKLPVTDYKNYFGGNIGFSMQRVSIKEEDQFLKKLSMSCMDYANPVGHIQTKTKAAVKNILNQNPEYYYSSKILLLETQLLPMKIKISDIDSQEPRVLRMASMLKKLKNCIYDLGTDEILEQLDISTGDITLAKMFLEDNKKDMVDFITKGTTNK